jgi:anti-sigma regulatory factor (Ser/Thr protein kinase)
MARRVDADPSGRQGRGWLMEILSMTLPLSATAPRQARRALAGRFAGHPRGEDLLLCVSEVVTNAILHAGTPPHLRVSQVGDTVRVEVADADQRRPVMSADDPLATSGRGLRILDQLAARWGSIPTGPGKAVWFEFDL